jgi:hypothetical protein
MAWAGMRWVWDKMSRNRMGFLGVGWDKMSEDGMGVGIR